MGLGIVEALVVLVGLIMSLAPLVIAIWALVTASRLRTQVYWLEQRISRLESRRPPPPTA